MKICPICRGNGRRHNPDAWGREHAYLCKTCKGAGGKRVKVRYLPMGESPDRVCDDCAGTGIRPEARCGCCCGTGAATPERVREWMASEHARCRAKLLDLSNGGKKWPHQRENSLCTIWTTHTAPLTAGQQYCPTCPHAMARGAQ